MGKQVYLVGIIVYSLLSFIVQFATKVRWIDAFTVFILCGIFYQILDWKYATEEDNNEF